MPERGRCRLRLLGVLAREAPLQLALVERALPLGDDERRNPVADQVRRRERLRHQAVDAEDERDALDRDRSDGRERRGEHDKGGAGDAGRSLRGEQQHRQQTELLLEAERRIRRLREKDGRGCNVDAWSSSSAIRLSPSRIRACRFPAPGSSRG
jgi:hypothetical protein